ncbi:MAG: folylpolyglutamate synthase/dihydrofolate synthase family protein [Ignavibacteriaceae bacterium]
MDIEKSLQKLYSLHTFGIKLGLENIEKFLHYIGNPQKELRVFHIAGSNGKGSTASFVASILMELNYKVGLYTSPHFVRFNERVKINNMEIADHYISSFMQEYNNYIDDNRLTFFEVTTAMAFKYFMEQNVDYAVIETGLGGRLDATNTINPLAAVITSISLEHTNILGNTIGKIAAEKAGIIKHRSKVFTGYLPADAEKVVEDKCDEKECDLFKLKDYIVEKESSLELFNEENEISKQIMTLKGSHQNFNAALAGLTVSKSLNIIDFNPIKRGIKNIIKNTGIQGRYEFYHRKPDIIFDSAHNPEGVKSFIDEFRKDYTSYSRRTLLFGVMKDKAIEEMLLNMKDYFDEIYITEIENERSAKIEMLLEISSGINLDVKIEKEPDKLLTEFETREKDECLVILGSMYLIGEIKSMLKKIIT